MSAVGLLENSLCNVKQNASGMRCSLWGIEREFKHSSSLYQSRRSMVFFGQGMCKSRGCIWVGEEDVKSEISVILV